MTHEELRGQYDLYAIGVADEPERNEIREHLSRGCEVCMAEIKRAREVTTLLLSGVPQSQPSPKLRRRILASAGFEQRSFLFLWAGLLGAAAMLSLVAAVYFGGREKEFAGQVARLSDQMRRQTVELTRLNEAFAILNAPGTTETSFGQGEPKPPKGRVFMNPSMGVLLIASNLPPASAGKVYEMWVIPKGGKPVPAGLFQSETDGTAMHVHRTTMDPTAVAAVAVTIENEGGATEPNLPPVFAAPMP
jgi:anti-sigma-K factor RskA